MKLYIGINSGALGADNQTLALLNALKSRAIRSRSIFFDSPDKNLLKTDKEAFKQTLRASLDSLYAAKNNYPRMFVLPFIQGNDEESFAYVEAVSQNIKEYYKQKKLKAPKTIVLTSRYPNKTHRCPSVDIINVGAHMMSDEDKKDLAVNKELKNRLVITTGVAGYITPEILAAEAEKHAAGIQKFRDGRSVALFSVGGRDELNNIKFSIRDAEKLLRRAKEIQKAGWHVVMTNGPRTPTDVTDYLYENCKNSGMYFYNAKSLIEPGKTFSEEEKERNFRIYDGKYQDVFRKQAAETGNIYKALLFLCQNKGLFVGTMDSFSYTSDAAVLGIKTAVYSGMEINENRSDCRNLYDDCLQKGCILDFEKTDLKKLLDGKALVRLPSVTDQIVNFVIQKGRRYLFPKKQKMPNNVLKLLCHNLKLR